MKLLITLLFSLSAFAQQTSDTLGEIKLVKEEGTLEVAELVTKFAAEMEQTPGMIFTTGFTTGFNIEDIENPQCENGTPECVPNPANKYTMLSVGLCTEAQPYQCEALEVGQTYDLSAGAAGAVVSITLMVSEDGCTSKNYMPNLTQEDRKGTLTVHKLTDDQLVFSFDSVEFLLQDTQSPTWNPETGKVEFPILDRAVFSGSADVGFVTPGICE